jgi:hypothetical protein
MNTNPSVAAHYLSPEAYLLGENGRVDGVKYEIPAHKEPVPAQAKTGIRMKTKIN